MTLEERVKEWLRSEGLDEGGAPLARACRLLDLIQRERELALFESPPLSLPEEPAIPAVASLEWQVEEVRHVAALRDFARRWPNFRKHVATGVLAGAIALCDRWDVDVEQFVQYLRKATPKATVLPPS